MQAALFLPFTPFKAALIRHRYVHGRSFAHGQGFEQGRDFEHGREYEQIRDVGADGRDNKREMRVVPGPVDCQDKHIPFGGNRPHTLGDLLNALFNLRGMSTQLVARIAL
ncbi:hypothetical protein ACFP9V_18410 [Deinococcus radiopugnans]|uniref:hypothetical protein n=1 Tax=Deinococcus radiopugnans TaxID=57497 RepID=UPI00360764EC